MSGRRRGAPEHDASSLRCDRHDMHLLVEGEERALAALMGHHLHTHNNTTVGGPPPARMPLVAWWLRGAKGVEGGARHGGRQHGGKRCPTCGAHQVAFHHMGPLAVVIERRVHGKALRGRRILSARVAKEHTASQ
eukprot:scaffold52816_cov59-Phaeocystis_antarctica.AAC.6